MIVMTDAEWKKEFATKRRPDEIYHIWTEPPYSIKLRNTPASSHYRYTGGDEAVIVGGEQYNPAPIWRDAFHFNTTDAISTTTLYGARVTEFLVSYIIQNPVDLLWVEIGKILKEAGVEDYTSTPRFIGHIKRVAMEGAVASANCVGFENYLKRPCLRWKYQKRCNHMIYDSMCQVNPLSYEVLTSVTVSNGGLTLTSPMFAPYEDGYFDGGFIDFDGVYRPIAYNVGNRVQLMYAINDLITGSVVGIYPGCDGQAETCRDKFNNMEHRLGFDWIPVDNPVLWSGGQR